jgi:GNAT superfamily N-acetyltransferase
MAARIAQAESAADIAAVAALFQYYAASLEVDLAYQGFEAELDGVPGKYAPPAGALLLARNCDGVTVGCVALRPLGDGACEMKRLYLAPSQRGTGLGLALAQAVIAAARAAGHREMLLNSLPSMKGAQSLSRRLGFEEIAPYYPSPVEGTVFMRLRLG